MSLEGWGGYFSLSQERGSNAAASPFPAYFPGKPWIILSISNLVHSYEKLYRFCDGSIVARHGNASFSSNHL